MADSSLTSIILTILILASFSTASEKVDGGIQFTYWGARGPNNWARLSVKFDKCAKGKSQSPIDIVKHKAVVNKNLKPLNREYHSANVTLVNYGFTVGVRYPNNTGVLILDGKKYSLKQMHWHSPSEHRIDGHLLDAELHLVHVAEDHNISVVAVLYKYGRPDPIVAKIQSKLTELGHFHGRNEVKMGPFNPRQLKKKSHKYYRYIGSFTTPPCTENVNWIILGKVRHISRKQVEALQAPLEMECKKNSRPVQPLNGRHVELYENSHGTKVVGK